MGETAVMAYTYGFESRWNYLDEKPPWRNGSVLVLHARGDGSIPSGGTMRKKYPWEEKEISYSEWGSMDFDWTNYYKVSFVVGCYQHRYNNYHKGLKNEHIMRSTFGRKEIWQIKAEINDWFTNSIGANNEIEY
tara:strand:+ start:151104 stop:151505 length:402 start_codon:yes stop_codon:yes gene_type:complete